MLRDVNAVSRAKGGLPDKACQHHCGLGMHLKAYALPAWALVKYIRQCRVTVPL